MQASKKILITVAGVLIAFLITSVFIVKEDLQAVVDNYGAAHRYIAIPTEFFDKLKISANWDVKISQGRDHKLEVINPDSLNAQLQNVDGTVHFAGDSTAQLRVARVTVPRLQSIEAKGNAVVELIDFTQDSLNVSISDSVFFISSDNSILKMPVSTSGRARMEVRTNPN
ncbi:MAG: DUF2807 domain-containing protein [Cyclobacteriaceae bacterium]